MKFSAKLTMVFSAIFATICFSVAIKGFMSPGDMTDAVELANAKGFAWFWAFLGGVAVVMGALSWWMACTADEDE
ncbi:MAG: hypothetical protein V4568_16190 [Pseudomonadota bacterium]